MTNVIGPSSAQSSPQRRRLNSNSTASAAEMAKVTTGNSAVQVATAFFRQQTDGYREKLQRWVGKKALLRRECMMTTGASKPAARGGSRRKGSTCASEVCRGPPKSKRRKRNALFLRTIIFTHTYIYIYISYTCGFTLCVQYLLD